MAAFGGCATPAQRLVGARNGFIGASVELSEMGGGGDAAALRRVEQERFAPGRVAGLSRMFEIKQAEARLGLIVVARHRLGQPRMGDIVIPGSVFAGQIKLGDLHFGFLHALFRRDKIPAQGRIEVARNAISRSVKGGDVEGGGRMSLFGGGEEPAGGLVKVDVADGAGGGQATRYELRLHVALFGREFVPFESLPKIGREIAAAAVNFGQRQD